MIQEHEEFQSYEKACAGLLLGRVEDCIHTRLSVVHVPHFLGLSQHQTFENKDFFLIGHRQQQTAVLVCNLSRQFENLSVSYPVAVLGVPNLENFEQALAHLYSSVHTV